MQISRRLILAGLALAGLIPRSIIDGNGQSREHIAPHSAHLAAVVASDSFLAAQLQWLG